MAESDYFTLFIILLMLSCAPQVFHDVAYKAKDRNDLVAGIDEFLDQVTVLPPGEWDPSIRIEPPKNVPSQVNSHFTCFLTHTYILVKPNVNMMATLQFESLFIYYCSELCATCLEMFKHLRSPLISPALSSAL